MKRSLYVLPLAMFLATGYPSLSLAQDPAAECRKMAAEEEVAPEDMEDYIAECLAVVQSESPGEGGLGMDDPNAGDGAGPEPGRPIPPVPPAATKPAPAPAAAPATKH